MNIFPCLIAFIAELSFATTENWPMINSSYNSLIRAYEGDNITIKCAGREENAPGLWKFKACGIGLSTICLEIDSEKTDTVWNTLSQNTSKLTLSNIKNSQAGFYQCMQHATSRIDIYNTIQLEVYPKYSDSINLPRFLEGFPKNITVAENSQAIFQCKVLSVKPVSIRWLWQGQGMGLSFSSIRHLNQWYEIVGTGQQGEAGLVSLAKLHIPRVTTSDLGRYYCVAVNRWGFVNSSAYLNIYSDVVDTGEKSHFYIFFLIPLCFVLIPISMWICYIWCRRRRRHIDLFNEILENNYMLRQF